jgi:hypothetical protein
VAGHLLFEIRCVMRFVISEKGWAVTTLFSRIGG